MKTTKELVFIVLVLSLITEVANADFTFSKPTKVPNINSSYNEFNASISADGLSLYFISNRPGGVGGTEMFAGLDIWVTTRETTDDPWGTPVNLGPTVNTTVGEAGVSISSDGLSLYLDTVPPGLSGVEDLYVSTRATIYDDWGTPENLGPTVNSSADDCYVSISADELELYFTANRGGGYGSYDLWVTKRETVNDPWDTPENLGPTINSSTAEGQTSISADGRMLFFVTDRSGGYGQIDIWVSNRATTDDPWGEPVNLGSTINSSGWDEYPNVSADGSVLYFRTSQSGRWGNDGDIWQSSIIPIVDFSGNGICDIDDLVIMIENWGTSNSLCDIGPMPWGDGIVNRADLENFMKYYNQVIDVTAYYKLDETEGDIACDSSGNYHDALVIEDPIWQPEGGMIDGALEFDGIDDYVSTPFVLNPADGPFSIVAWVKGGAPGQIILSTGDSSLLSADASGGCLMTDVASSRAHLPLFSQTAITDGYWHRVGLTWDGSNRVLYVDDAAVASGTLTAMPNSEEGLHIGVGTGLEPSSFWTGMIDDVRIYNRVIIP